MTTDDRLDDLEHRVVALEREFQILISKLRDKTTNESLNGVDVVRSFGRSELNNVHDSTSITNVPVNE